MECSYGIYRGTKETGTVSRSAASQNASYRVDTPSLMTGTSPRIFDDGSINPSLMTQEQDAGFVLSFDSQGGIEIDSMCDDTRSLICNNMLNTNTASLPSDEELPSLLPASNLALDGINAFLLGEEGPTHIPNPSMPLAADDQDEGTSDARSLVPIPGRTIGAPSKPFSHGISKGCRRFILSIIRTYPGMMATADYLPPYVHRVGCGLHFDDNDELLHSAETAAFAPLKPLAACYGIAQVFASRGRNTSDFLWRTIENEHLLIRSEVY